MEPKTNDVGDPMECEASASASDPLAYDSRPTEPSVHATAAQEDGVYRSPYLVQVTEAEYCMQAGSFTQQALRELKASQEYRQFTRRCHR